MQPGTEPGAAPGAELLQALLAKLKNRIVYVHIKGKEIGSSTTCARFWSKYRLTFFFFFLILQI